MFGRKRHSGDPAAPESAAESAAWRVAGWDKPDLVYAVPHLRRQSRHWRTYEPALELVPCGDGPAKPAVFLRVGVPEYPAWTQTVEPTHLLWNHHVAPDEKPYVLLRLSIFFRNTAGTPIGMAGEGMITTVTWDAHQKYGHQLVCSTLFDPADPDHREAVHAWATAPGEAMLFFVGEDLDNANYLTLNLSDADRAPALTAWADAERELQSNPRIVPGGFADAAAALKKSHPTIKWWR